MSPYINDNLENLQNIEQNNFNIINELGIGIQVVQDRNGQAIFLTAFRDRLLDNGLTHINRNTLTELIHAPNNPYSSKEICVIIICWGIYFSVMRPVNQNNIVNLSLFLDLNNDQCFENLRVNVFNVNPLNLDGVKNLFRSFNGNGYQNITGIGYAFFTKFFFFFSNENTLPILDKWMTKSFLYLIHTDPICTQEYRNNLSACLQTPANPFGNFQLLRNKANFYTNYTSYMNIQVDNINQIIEAPISLNKLETFLFGWDLRINGVVNYINPRITYNNFFANIPG